MLYTDFIPETGIPTQVTCLLTGTANRNVGTGKTTMPTPSCAEVGDWQVAVWSWWTNDTPNWSISNFGKDLGQWWVVNASRNFVDGPIVMIRKITAGNISQPFEIGATAGATGISYITWIAKNEIIDFDPVIGVQTGGAVWPSLSSTNTSVPASRGWSPTSMPFTSDLDLVLVTNGFSSPTPLVPAEDSGVRVLLSRTSPPNSNASGTAAVLQRQALDPYIDLNGGGHPLDGWTGFNVTINTAPTNRAQAFTINEQAVSNTRHGIYKDFYLEAGKTYDFTFDSGQVGQTGTGASETCTYLGYVDPNAVEHGYANNESVNVATVPVGTQVTANNYLRHYGYDNNGFGGFRYSTTLRIVPTVTGTHRLWVGFCIQSQCATLPTSLFNRSGNTARAFRGAFLTVVEVKNASFETLGGARCKRNNPLYRDYYYSDRLLAPNRQGQTTAQNVTACTVFRGSANKRPLMRMGGSALEHAVSASPSPNRTIPGDEQYNFPAQRYLFEYSDHAVGPWISTKFYYEATIDAYYAGQFFGVSTASPQCKHETTLMPGTFNDDYSGVISGTMYVRNTSSVIGTWTTGDVIGVLLDYDAGNVKYYKNGVLLGTAGFAGLPRFRWCMYRVMVSRLWAGEGSSASRYTLNLTGPFLYPPAGAVPFDFDNLGAPLGYQLFTSSGTFDKSVAAGANLFVVHAVGGGGGGGSGSVGSRSSTYCGGGEGGGGGGYSSITLPAASVGANETVTVGLGGAGGPADGPSTGVVAGTPGSNGSASSFGAHVSAGGGNGGNCGWQGNTANSQIGSGGTGNRSSGGGGWRLVPNGGSATVLGSENGSTSLGPGGGGAGGGGTYVGGVANYSGSKGGDAPTDDIPAGGAGGIAAMATNPGSASADVGAVNYPLYLGTGAGGGGGNCWYPVNAGSDPTGPSGAGGNAGTYGGGGGGGGAGCSYGTGYPGTGGKGGDGAPGYVLVVWYA